MNAGGPDKESVDQARLTDEQLFGKYRAGDIGGYEQLVERYRRELFHFLVRYCGDRATADDLFQDAFLQVHISADSFDLSKRFKPWLFTIAANKARDHLRRNSRRQAASLSERVGGQEDGRAFVDLLQADLVLPDVDAQDQEQRRLVREVVETLPDHLREVLILAYFNQFAYKEIAEMLTIPLGTVKSRLHAAVGTFAELWRSRFEPAQGGNPEK